MKDIDPTLRKVCMNPKCSEPFGNRTKNIPSANLPEKLLAGYHKITNLAINKSCRETQFKIMHRTYIPYLNIPSLPDAGLCAICNTSRPLVITQVMDMPTSILILGPSGGLCQQHR